jgi:hypothetical protein
MLARDHHVEQPKPGVGAVKTDPKSHPRAAV